MRTQLALLLVIVAFPLLGRAADLAHSENFIVLAPDRAAAEQILRQAERYRKEVAREWLGQELPPSVGRTTIHVDFVESEDRAFAWPAEGPGRSYHKVWLTTSRERALGSTLRHEIAHVVLNTRYPQKLPAWADEGIASLYDSPHRAETRRTILAWYRQTGNWPHLLDVLNTDQIAADNLAAYSVAASVTEYLLLREDKPALLAFAIAGKQEGWDHALQTQYGISSVAELERAWHTWLARGDSPTNLASRNIHARPSVYARN